MSTPLVSTKHALANLFGLKYNSICFYIGSDQRATVSYPQFVKIMRLHSVTSKKDYQILYPMRKDLSLGIDRKNGWLQHWERDMNWAKI